MVIRLQETDVKMAECHSLPVEAIYAQYCRGGGMGRRTGLKIRAKGIRQTQVRSRIPFFVLLFKRSTVYIEVYQYVVLYTSDRHLYGHQLLQLDLAPFKG
jgi:hypothetical protein